MVQVVGAGLICGVAVIATLTLAVTHDEPLIVPVGALLLVVLLYGLATLTHEASVLTWTPVRRVLWAVLTVALGIGLALVILEGTREAERISASVHQRSESPLGLTAIVVPFVLAAGLLLRSWYLRLMFVAAGVVLPLVLWIAILPDPRAAEVRLAHAKLDRSTLFSLDLPGYAAYPDQPFGAPRVHPESSTDPARDIAVTLESGAICPTPAWVVCEPEGHTLTYRRMSNGESEYMAVRGERVRVKVHGGAAVDRETLRAAIQGIRQVSDEQVRKALPPASGVTVFAVLKGVFS
ncbi:hypothetical protein D5S17_11640 [Pseudonocardiaceae bacterium YIM PH 21723]|nr:hypothetical protein D5S17_11640 [Pseudonocardiaceae bacterium YIM PH 21723]